MNRWIVFFVGLVLAGVVAASDSVRFGSQVITVGDSEGRVRRAAGEPARVVRLENRFGGAAGYRLDYENGRSTIQITIEAGRVVRIEELF